MDVVKSFLHGLKGPIIGVIPFLQLLRAHEVIRNKLLKCVLLNGVVLLLSIIIFEYVVLRVIEIIVSNVYSTLVSPSETGIFKWLTTVLWYVFTGFWVLPLSWISKPINTIWFMDIASATYEANQKNKDRRKAKPKSILSQGVSVFIADMLFSLVLELLFLVQGLMFSQIPFIGGLLNIFHLAMYYSLYAFEYKWINEGWRVEKRVSYIEQRWPYFLGFGLPLALAVGSVESTIISGCIYAMGFPLFIISASKSQPEESASKPFPQIPIFKLVVSITNKIFTRNKAVTSTPAELS